MSNEFKYGDEVFCCYLDDNGEQKDGFFYVVELGQTATILKTKAGGVLFLPVHRILKIKKKEYKYDL